MRLVEQHLAAHGAAGWATEISRCRIAIESSDAWGLYRFLAMFGGMGSLNDLVLQRGSQMLVAENDQLQHLLGSAWRLADQLRQEA